MTNRGYSAVSADSFAAESPVSPASAAACPCGVCVESDVSNGATERRSLQPEGSVRHNMLISKDLRTVLVIWSVLNLAVSTGGNGKIVSSGGPPSGERQTLSHHPNGKADDFADCAGYIDFF